MDTDERAWLYVEFLEQAAAEYRCKVTDMPAKAAAVRRLAFELCCRCRVALGPKLKSFGCANVPRPVLAREISLPSLGAV